MATQKTWETIKDMFSPVEFGEGAEEGMKDDYLIKLYRFRTAIDNPMNIHQNGGFSRDGHSKDSMHYQGRAIDFHFKYNPVSLRKLIITAVKCGLHGIGIYPYWKPFPGGFHLDDREGGRFNIWRRNEKGIYHYMFPYDIAESLEEWR